MAKEEKVELEYENIKKERAAKIKDIVPGYVFGRFKKLKEQLPDSYFVWRDTLTGEDVNYKEYLFKDLEKLERDLKEGDFAWDADLPGQIHLAEPFVGGKMGRPGVRIKAMQGGEKVIEAGTKVEKLNPYYGAFWMMGEGKKRNRDTSTEYIKTKSDNELFKQYAHALREFLDAAYKQLSRKVPKGEESGGDLVSRLSTILAIAGILAGIFFLSPIVTGNAIGTLSSNTTNGIGAALIAMQKEKYDISYVDPKDPDKSRKVKFISSCLS